MDENTLWLNTASNRPWYVSFHIAHLLNSEFMSCNKRPFLVVSILLDLVFEVQEETLLNWQYFNKLGI